MNLVYQPRQALSKALLLSALAALCHNGPIAAASASKGTEEISQDQADEPRRLQSACSYNWTDMSYGKKAYSITASWQGQTGVWIMQVGGLQEGNAMAKLNESTRRWEVDSSQPASAYTALSRDNYGNPVFCVNEPYRAWIKKNGRWSKLDGCMGRVAWGGEGSMYRRTCEASNYGYVELNNGGEWERIGNQLAYEVTADHEGTPWIVSKGGTEPMMKWTGNSWQDMGLADGYNINAGPANEIFGTAPPNVSGGQSLYRYRGGTSWDKIQGPNGGGTKKVAVGVNGRLYMTNTQNDIYGDESENCALETTLVRERDDEQSTTSTTSTGAQCGWQNINYGQQAYSVTASWQGSIGVWIMQVGGLQNGNAMAKLNESTRRWEVDPSQPASAYTALSRDNNGNPVFCVAEPYRAWIKKNGQWSQLDGCMGRVAWGGDGSMYRRTCEASNYGYVELNNGGDWERIGNQLAYEITGDHAGTPWIVSKGGTEPIMKWTGSSWQDMGLADAYNMNAGPEGHIYGTAPPNCTGGQTLYKWTGGYNWEKVPGPDGSCTKKIAVGVDGRRYMTTSQNDVYGDECGGDTTSTTTSTSVVDSSCGWKDIGYGQQAYSVVASWQGSIGVWIMQVGGLNGGNAMAKLNENTQEWEVDPSQPASAYTALSRDNYGNPVFCVNEPYRAWIKKNGQWSKLDGCMGRVAWGGDGSMYRRTCEASNYGYVELNNGGDWERIGNQLAYEITGDHAGTPWIVSKGGTEPIMKWTGNSWQDMGLADAYNMNAGPAGHIYGTAPPNLSGGQTLYRWMGDYNWEKVPGPNGQGTKKVAVGVGGILYMTTSSNTVHEDGCERTSVIDDEPCIGCLPTVIEEPMTPDPEPIEPTISTAEWEDEVRIEEETQQREKREWEEELAIELQRRASSNSGTPSEKVDIVDLMGLLFGVAN